MFSFLRSKSGQKAKRRPAVSRAVRLNVEGCEERNPAATVYGLTDLNQIIRFDSATPTNILGTVNIQGLNAGERVVGIDFRPRTGQLFGLVVGANGTAATVQTITVNPLTGVTTRLGGPVAITADPLAAYGFDFNPTVDRIRVVNSADGNIRLNPNNGALAGTDTALNPSGQMIDSSAYDRNFDGTAAGGLANGPGTTLFSINPVTGNLVTQGGINGSPSPNLGNVANVVGPLGTPIDPFEFVGFDIKARGTAGGNGFAVYDPNTSGSGLSTAFYNINLGTGASQFVGLVGNGLTRVQGIAAVPDNTRVVGLNGGAGTAATVLVQDAFTNANRIAPITPFAGYNGTLVVGSGDFNRDSVPDVMVAANGANGAAKVFDGATGAELLSVAAFEGFRGTVTVAGGDVNGDGFHDLIIGANGANGAVKAFSGAPATRGQLLSSFLAYQGYRGSISVGAADFDNDGTDTILVGAGARGVNGFVGTFNQAGQATSGGFTSFAGFGGPISVAGGDVNGDGTPDIIVGAGAAGGGAVRAFSGATGNPLVASFFSFEQSYTGGVSVGTADVNQDGRYEIEVAPHLGRSAEVRSFNGLTGNQIASTVAAANNRGATVAGQRF